MKRHAPSPQKKPVTIATGVNSTRPSSSLSRPTTASAARAVRSSHHQGALTNSIFSSKPSSQAAKSKRPPNRRPTTPVPEPVPLTEKDIDFLPDMAEITAQYSSQAFHTPVELNNAIENEDIYREERLMQLRYMNEHYHNASSDEKKELGKGMFFSVLFAVGI